MSAALRRNAATSLLPGSGRMPAKCRRPGRETNEKSSVEARFLRHRHRDRLRVHHASSRAGEKKYDPGASDTEIKLGQTVPHSGPGSLYGVLGRVGEAYFQMINEQGGSTGARSRS